MGQIIKPAEAISSNVVLDKLREYFAPVRNVLYERHEFSKAVQQPDEAVDQFVVCLMQLAAQCKFSTTHKNNEVSFEDKMLKDRLIFGCADQAARSYSLGRMMYLFKRQLMQ